MSQTMTQTSPQAASARLMEMIFGFALSRSISVAAQFGIADLLKDNPKSPDELAQAIGVHSRSLYRMLRGLASAGIFVEGADGRFSLTPLSEPLCSDAPESLRAFAALMADKVNFETWAELPYSIQNGKPVIPHKFVMSWLAWLDQNPPEGKAFHYAVPSLSFS